jgi:TonB family protein
MVRPISILICYLLLSTSLIFAKPNSFNDETSVQWQRFDPKDEEFIALFPVEPENYIIGENVCLGGSGLGFCRGIEVDKLEVYSAFFRNAVILIRSYKTSDHKALSYVLRDGSWRVKSSSTQTKVTIDGFNGQIYEYNSKDFYTKSLYVAAKKHVYQVSISARDSSHPLINAFLSNFRLNSTTELKVPTALNWSNTIYNSDSENPLSSKELPTKYVILNKPEPRYTREARRNGITGTVRLKAVLAASGKVTHIVIMKALPDGLTENAIEAAKRIRFLPSIKDGKLVSTYVTLEYGFAMY